MMVYSVLFYVTLDLWGTPISALGVDLYLYKLSGFRESFWSFDAWIFESWFCPLLLLSLLISLKIEL